MGTRRLQRLLTGALALLLGPSAAAALEPPGPFRVCIDYHCDEFATARLDASQWQEIAALFTDVRDAATERARIRQAIALFEIIVGNQTGTWRDLGENAAGGGEPGQLDCISESKNTTLYLELLIRQGLVRWHSIEPRELRHTYIFVAHWSAVIRERASGNRYAVDSWFLDNGQPPYIQPLQDWLDGKDFPPG